MYIIGAVTCGSIAISFFLLPLSFVFDDIRINSKLHSIHSVFFFPKVSREKKVICVHMSESDINKKIIKEYTACIEGFIKLQARIWQLEEELKKHGIDIPPTLSVLQDRINS